MSQGVQSASRSRSDGDREGGQDAVCFSSSLGGAIFGTGAIHAYLASDRKHPRIAAGIFLGALCAAAMQRSYKDLEREDEERNPTVLEADRWRWFQRLLHKITDRPLSVLWRSLPDRSDFFAEFPTQIDPATPEDFRKADQRAAEKRDQLAKLVRWIARLPISVSEVARLVDAFVTFKQKSKVWAPQLIANAFWVCDRVALFVFLQPFLGLGSSKGKKYHPRSMSPSAENLKAEEPEAEELGAEEAPEAADAEDGEGFKARLKPLFGWWVWMGAGTLVASTLLVLFPLLGFLAVQSGLPFDWWKSSGVMFLLIAVAVVKPGPRGPLTGIVLMLVTLVPAGFALGYLDPGLPGAWYWVLMFLILAVAVVGPGPRLAPLTGVVLMLVVWALAGFALACLDPGLPGAWYWGPLLLVWLGLRLPWLLSRKYMKKTFSWLKVQVLRNLRLEYGLMDGFQMDRELADLFDGGQAEPSSLDCNPFPVVIVASALQPLLEPVPPKDPETGAGGETGDGEVAKEPVYHKQLFARPGTPLVRALSIALRRVQLLGWTKIKEKEHKNWLVEGMEVLPADGEKQPGALKLAAGTLARHNVMPALFQYLHLDRKENPTDSIEKKLTESDRWGQRAIHMLYETPMRRSSQATQGTGTGLDIVELGMRGLQLAERRDTQLEVKQVNFVSRLEQALRERREDSPTDRGEADDEKPKGRMQLFADEIAPEDDFGFEKLLNPKKKELLEWVAQGCRRTLETLYKDELVGMTPLRVEGPQADVECRTLLRKLAPRRAKWLGTEACPGLPEVCEACTRKLKAPHVEPQEAPRLSITEFDNLTGSDPRIIFVASGGVFRGAFHIGLIAALKALNIRPDLIAGASVGTLLGAALAALSTLDEKARREDRAQDADRLSKRADEVLGYLVDCFVGVDEKVAFTRRFLNALREIATRALTIKLSPSRLRKMVASGSQKDPGYAATGAPPALIDAISRLFLLPHVHTSNIAAELIAGQYGKGMVQLSRSIRKESLRRLGVENALVGRSLLERIARKVLDDVDLTRRQPFAEPCKIAFIATGTNLSTEQLCCFGAENIFKGAPYDFLKAALASGAFPAIFAPIRESDIFPGVGRNDILYSDGGMFDNLPMGPAVDVLAACQGAAGGASAESIWESLQARHQRPDLFLVGSLDVYGATEGRPKDGVFQEHLKIRSFENLSYRIDDQCEMLIGIKEVSRSDDLRWAEKYERILAGTVPAGVLPIRPRDTDHLNGTYSFCSTLGLEKKTVLKSIGHGCFQTMDNLFDASKTRKETLRRAFTGLFKNKRLPEIAPRGTVDSATIKQSGECPYFVRKYGQGGESTPFECPFAKLESNGSDHGSRVFEECRKDPLHQGIFDRPKTEEKSG